jgi:hypothetical protein
LVSKGSQIPTNAPQWYREEQGGTGTERRTIQSQGNPNPQFIKSRTGNPKLPHDNHRPKRPKNFNGKKTERLNENNRLQKTDARIQTASVRLLSAMTKLQSFILQN